MSLMNALGTMLGASKDYCPDCGMEMKSNGCCDECGYGEEDDMEEEANTQALLDLKKHLQSAMEMVDRLIVKGD